MQDINKPIVLTETPVSLPFPLCPMHSLPVGVTLGLSPAGSLLCDTAAAAAFVAAHTTSAFTAWELSLLLGVLRCCWETVELLASGTLALRAIVLAASLFGPRQGATGAGSSSSGSRMPDGAAEDGRFEGPGEGFRDAQKGTVEVESPGGSTMEFEGLASSAEPDSAGFGSSSSFSSSTSISRSSSSFGSGLIPQLASSSAGGTFGSGGSSSGASGYRRAAENGINVTHRSASTADDASSSVLSQLTPQAAWEWRAMLSVAAVRFVLLPSATTGLVLAALRFGLLPAEPVCAFMLLLQSCMPPAQNLVLMMQLQPSTSALAPATARLLLQLYTLAVFPVTLWVSVFAKLVL